jgi:hypothetical protein
MKSIINLLLIFLLSAMTINAQSTKLKIGKLPRPGQEELVTKTKQVSRFGDGGAFIMEVAGQDVLFKPKIYPQFKIKTSSGLELESTDLLTTTAYESESDMLFEDRFGNISGTITTESGTYDIVTKNKQVKIKHQSDDMEPFECGAMEMPDNIKRNLEKSGGDTRAVKCVEIYLEVAEDIYQAKGGLFETTEYITNLFLQVQKLYAAQDLHVAISDMMIWDTESPYLNDTLKNSSSKLLTFFRKYRTSYDGDVAQLLAYTASGGIAYINSLCRSYSYSFSSLHGSFEEYPRYSWDVMVMSHELGHNLGSYHTHACRWNGDDTAIDGCAGFTEGGCELPPNPPDGGTVMSYCHLRDVGINFGKGFHQQPRDLIASNIATKPCLGSCIITGDPDPPSDSCSQVRVVITLDDYPMETSWALINTNTLEVIELFETGDYTKQDRNRTYVYEYCLPNGCYDFEVVDSYQDGMCCNHGEGKIEVYVNDVLKTDPYVANFFASYQTQICIDDPDPIECYPFNFLHYNISSYGGAQDRTKISVVGEGGYSLSLIGNTWKRMKLIEPYEITENTVMTFQFWAKNQGEIHGIGFDNDNSISSMAIFQLWGYQSYGIDNYRNYDTPEEYVRYDIPVGKWFAGMTTEYIVFVNDDDNSARTTTNDSRYRGLVLHEGDCDVDFRPEPLVEPTTEYNNIREKRGKPESDQSMGEIYLRNKEFNFYPNPAADIINVSTRYNMGYSIKLYNIIGSLLDDRNIDIGGNTQIDVSELKPGTYFIEIITADGDHFGEKVTIQ